MTQTLIKKLILSVAPLAIELLLSPTVRAEQILQDTQINPNSNARQSIKNNFYPKHIPLRTSIIDNINQNKKLISIADRRDREDPPNSPYQGGRRGDLQMSQVTSVSQLSDIQPSDWAFQALQSLVERYGVIAGYSDSTFRGDRAMTRYEFAAGLNAALARINEQIAAGNPITQTDLATLQKLQTDFATELATLRGRVDRLEVQTAHLESNQFSTTTKLEGTVIFALSDAFGGGGEDNGDDNNTVLQSRARLAFETSFTGKDTLTTRLDFGNFEQFDLPTDEGRLGFDSNTEGSVELGSLEYELPVGEKITLLFQFNDSDSDDFTDVINPLFEDSDTGAISRFGRRNPIYRVPNSNTGIGARLQLSEAMSFDFAYLAGDANNPAAGAGLFNGDYGAIAQLTLTPSDRLAVGLTYIHSYGGAGQGLDTGTGSTAANLTQIGTPDLELPVVGNSYGIEASYRISENFAIGGWVGYTAARAIGLGDASIWNYAITFGFPDLGKEGNLGGIIIGMQPKLTGTSSSLRAVGQSSDPNTSIHIESFYKHQVTDNISITPGLIWLTAPNHNTENEDIIIGTIRTAFEF
ncbi:iron uptake porin [Scytonema millei]|uniref:Iron uptake porin n=1 Tax=Scytonema millei VB511283 TaxID=1245923 RepID=A0A9X5I3N1_9CYAN|nr:iron uptake porin [Scytonema millei]NHC33734.1 iron uptake porin [Scytonema millei VB511283]